MEKLNTLIRGAVTVAVLLAAAWWLVQVSSRLGVQPVVDDDGNVILDEYQRAKDILLVVLPLVTTSLGYWFGVQGKEKAEDRADAAVKETTAVVAVSQDPELLKKARDMYPEAFAAKKPQP